MFCVSLSRAIELMQMGDLCRQFTPRCPCRSLCTTHSTRSRGRKANAARLFRFSAATSSRSLPFMLKINHAEAASLIGTPVSDVKQAAGAVEVLQSKFSPLVMITLGAAGAVLASDDHRYFFVPPPIRARNTVGSGDAT